MFLEETAHKRSQSKDKGILQWLDPFLGHRTIDEIDRDLIDRIKLAHTKVGSRSTAIRYLAVIRSIFRKARDEREWVDHIPKVSLFKEPDGRTRSLSYAEFARLPAELPGHLAEMVFFKVATGLRQANVAKLEWAEVNLEQRHAWRPALKYKNGSPQFRPTQ